MRHELPSAGSGMPSRYLPGLEGAFRPALSDHAPLIYGALPAQFTRAISLLRGEHHRYYPPAIQAPTGNGVLQLRGAPVNTSVALRWPLTEILLVSKTPLRYLARYRPDSGRLQEQLWRDYSAKYSCLAGRIGKSRSA